MPFYNFKRDIKVYVVNDNKRYLLDVYPDISFSQTFEETQYSVKTLHEQLRMFDGAVINKASPANFTITLPFAEEFDFNIIYQLLVDYDPTSTEAVLKTADIYVETNTEVYKLEKAVIERGIFGFVRDKLMTISVSGTASRLRKMGTPGTFIVPGQIQPRDAGGRHFVAIEKLQVKLANNELESVTSVSLEIVNNIQWLPQETLHKSLAVTSASDTMYPEAFVVSGRAVTGTIQQYVTDTSNNTQTWVNGTSLYIKVGPNARGFEAEFTLPSVVYTNRLEVQELLLQSYDFRLVDSPLLN